MTLSKGQVDHARGLLADMQAELTGMKLPVNASQESLEKLAAALYLKSVEGFWSKEKPTAIGFYWYQHENKTISIVHYIDGYFTFEGNEEIFKAEHLQGFFFSAKLEAPKFVEPVEGNDA